MLLDESNVVGGLLHDTSEHLGVQALEARSWVWCGRMPKHLGRALELRLQLGPVVAEESDDPVAPAVDGMGYLIERGWLLLASQVGDELFSRGPRVDLEPRL
jgi:hypothetical protein